jgi:hypothetical protein
MRSAVKWSLRLLLAFLVLAVLWVAPLVWPKPLFSHEARFGDYRVYSDAPLPADFARVRLMARLCGFMRVRKAKKAYRLRLAQR